MTFNNGAARFVDVDINNLEGQTFRDVVGLEVYGTAAAPGAVVGCILDTSIGPILLIQGCPVRFSDPVQVYLAGSRWLQGADQRVIVSRCPL